MEAPETLKQLEAFNKYVITQARANLTKGKRNVSKRLYNSLKGEVKVMPNSIFSRISMEDYGSYQDQGVKGAASSTKAPNSPFKFGSGTGKPGGLTSGILGWVRKRRFQFRDISTGKFKSYEETARLITRSVYLTGMRPTRFISKPFEDGFKRLPDELAEAYGLDVESFMKFILKK